MRALAILGLAVLVGCGDDATAIEEGTSDALSAANALTQNATFEDAELRSGELPAADAADVLLLPLVDAVVMSPGQTSLMPLNVFNLAAQDPVVATLLQFGDSPDHLRVPVPRQSGTEGDIDNPLRLSEDACEGLCARAFVVEVVEALELESGAIGKHAGRTVVLDCREDPKAARCEGDAEANPDASFEVPLDASLPAASRVRMGLLDAVKTLCACDAGARPAALVCAGTLAEVNVRCHTSALQAYASDTGADLQCAIDGADSAARCLEGCDAAGAAECLTELTACGVNLAQVERALLTCETFACADGDGRIEGSLLCDGNADCADGSDEATPTCDGAAPDL